jgi:hypothetical protein
MALKKGLLDSYIKEREAPKTFTQPNQTSKYSHNRVFDEPESLKNIVKKIVDDNPLNADMDTPVVATQEVKEPEIKSPIENNQQVSKSEPITEPVTNGTQIGHERITNRSQGLVNIGLSDNKRLTEHVTIGAQTGNNQVNSNLLPRLTGIQRSIIIALYKNCRINGGNVTQELTLEYISSLTGVNKNSIKTSINRLKNKYCIGMVDYKDGRGGWVKYEISKQLFTELLQHEGLLQQNYNHSQTVNNLHTQPVTEPITSGSSSSRLINITTTTDLPDEWKKIDCTPLREINFSFIELMNIYKKRPEHITHHVVQDSINQFAFGLMYNPERYKGMTAKSGVLVKQLCQGTSWTEAAYVSQEEKIKAEKESTMTTYFEKQFKEPKFLEWFAQLSDQDKENLVPAGTREGTAYMVSKIQIQKEIGKNYFDRAIWPEILSNFKSAVTS